MCVKLRNSLCAIRSNCTLRKCFQLVQQKGVFFGGKFLMCVLILQQVFQCCKTKIRELLMWPWLREPTEYYRVSHSGLISMLQAVFMISISVPTWIIIWSGHLVALDVKKSLKMHFKALPTAEEQCIHNIWFFIILLYFLFPDTRNFRFLSQHQMWGLNFRWNLRYCQTHS